MNNWQTLIIWLSSLPQPVLFVDFPYGGTGGFLVYNSMFLREGRRNVGFVSSSNPGDLVEAVKCFQTIGRPSDFGPAVARLRRERTPGPGDLDGLPDPMPSLSTDEVLRKMKESKILAVGYPGMSAFWGPGS